MNNASLLAFVSKDAYSNNKEMQTRCNSKPNKHLKPNDRLVNDKDVGGFYFGRKDTNKESFLTVTGQIGRKKRILQFCMEVIKYNI